MSSEVALILTEKYRLDSVRLRKLEWIADQVGNGNKSKAVRHMIDCYSELLAYESHQKEVGARCT